MRGQILGVDAGRSVGVLVNAEGERLEFPLSEWRSPGQPVAGQWVDFVAANGAAAQIYLLPGAAAQAPGAPPRSQIGTVLGAVAVGCLVLGFAIPLLPTIAALVLGIVGAGRSKEEGDETGLLLSRIGWIGATVLLAMGIVILLGVFVFFGGIATLIGLSGALTWPVGGEWT